jgi:hypothetical protein
MLTLMCKVTPLVLRLAAKSYPQEFDQKDLSLANSFR